MPFLAAPLVLSSLIGAGGAVGGALLSRSNAQQRQAAQTLSQGQEAGFGFGRNIQPLAESSLAGAGRTYGTALDFFRPLVSGNRNAMMSVLSPEVKQISTGFDASLANLRELNPRSGGTAAIAAELPFRKASTLSDLFAQVRMAAAGQLPNIAAGQASLGGTVGGLANQGYGLGVSAADRAAMNQIYQRQQQTEWGTMIGKSLYDIIKSLPARKKSSEVVFE